MAWINRHPNLVTWALLAVGMVAIVGYSAKDVDTLSGGQWFWLAFATVLVAGLCAWIISWEADDELDDEAQDEADEEYEDGGGGEGDAVVAQSDEVDAMATDGDGA
ncbi:MAG: hypothetical protein ABI780_13435 [Ardenticatenales bacterium]